MGKRIFIQPDARGRIQLPPEYRQTPFFELQPEGDVLLLYPLHIERRGSNRSIPQNFASSDTQWLTDDVWVYLTDIAFPHFRKYLGKSASTWCHALFLFGSRIRTDALTSSDFDFAVLCDPFPTMTERNDFIDSFTQQTKDIQDTLSHHGVKGEFNFLFARNTLHESLVPPVVYFNIASEGLLIWQRNSSGDAWKEKMATLGGKIKLHAKGKGKRKKWEWTNK